MLEEHLLLLLPLFLVVGALYASVGHAGSSGYQAVMVFVGISATVMKPTALAVNVVVGAIAFAHFWRAGHFRFSLLWPFAIASVPAATLGGAIQLPNAWLKIAIGVVLILSAARMAWTALWPPCNPKDPTPPPLPTSLASGAVLGFVAGLTGTGGGIILSPLMLFMGWGDMKRTAATSAAFIVVNSIGGLAGQIGTGWTPTWELGALALAAAVGGWVGAWYGARHAAPATLRLLLSIVLLMAGIKLVVPASKTTAASSRSAPPASSNR